MNESELKKTKALAEQGDAEAQFQLAKYYDKNKESIKAVELYRQAAEQGHAKAQNNLGACYYNGDGVTKDIHEAFKWFEMAANNGNEKAKESLEKVKYLFEWEERKRKMKEEDEEYLRRLKDLAEQGDTEAQIRLGNVAEDVAEAMKWYRLAAEKGNVEAQFRLGELYSVEAVEWYRKAAEQGHASAQNNLGACYLSGNGTPEDIHEASKWFGIAASFGNENAKESLSKVKRLLDSTSGDVPKKSSSISIDIPILKDIESNIDDLSCQIENMESALFDLKEQMDAIEKKIVNVTNIGGKINTEASAVVTYVSSEKKPVRKKGMGLEKSPYYVEKGAPVTDLTVSNAQKLVVCSGGTAVNTTVEKGGEIIIRAEAIGNGIILNGGKLTVRKGGLAMDVVNVRGEINAEAGGVVAYAPAPVTNNPAKKSEKSVSAEKEKVKKDKSKKVSVKKTEKKGVAKKAEPKKKAKS